MGSTPSRIEDPLRTFQINPLPSQDSKEKSFPDNISSLERKGFFYEASNAVVIYLDI